MSDEKFSKSEPGMSHPLTRCAIRLTDDGRVVIMAGDHAGIVIDEQTGVVTIYGTEVRFVSGGIQINGSSLSETMLDGPSGATSIGKQLRRIDKVKDL